LYHGGSVLAFPGWGKSGGYLMTARKVGDHVEVEKDDARAGETGHHVRYILVFGVVLVIVGFAAVALGWFG